MSTRILLLLSVLTCGAALYIDLGGSGTCRTGKWCRYDAFYAEIHRPLTVTASLRLADNMRLKDMLYGSGKSVRFNKYDWATAAARSHNIFLEVEDESEIHDAVYRRIRFRVRHVLKVELQLHDDRKWKTVADEVTPFHDSMTEVDFSFSSEACTENCYGWVGWGFRLRFFPIDSTFIPEIDGLILDLCHTEYIYEAKPHLECLQTREGQDYIGTFRTSLSNIPCLPWDSSESHSSLHSRFPDGNVTVARDFCRNPTNEREGPFCVTSYKGELVEERCGIPQCDLPKRVETERVCFTGEMVFSSVRNTLGVRVRSSVGLETVGGELATAQQMITDYRIPVLPVHAQWENRESLEMHLFYDIPEDIIVGSFSITAENVARLTLLSSDDGIEWMDEGSMDILAKKTTQEESSSWRFSHYRDCYARCSGIDVRRLKLSMRGIDRTMRPRLVGTSLYGCRHDSGVVPVCQFGPIRTLDSSYRQFMDVRSNVELIRGRQELLFTGIQRSSWSSALRNEIKPFIEVSFMNKRTFVLRQLWSDTRHIHNLTLEASTDSVSWTKLGTKVVSSTRWTHPVSYRFHSHHCPHRCTGIRTRYIRLIFEGPMFASRPIMTGLKIETCYPDLDSPPPTVDCKSSEHGSDYASETSVSMSGEPCLYWNTTLDWSKHGFPDGTVNEARNYCRHPDFRSRHRSGPWCYTTSGEEYCDVPHC